jgi:polar amino acid transport system substrate-binding protein
MKILPALLCIMVTMIAILAPGCIGPAPGNQTVTPTVSETVTPPSTSLTTALSRFTNDVNASLQAMDHAVEKEAMVLGLIGITGPEANTTLAQLVNASPYAIDAVTITPEGRIAATVHSDAVGVSIADQVHIQQGLKEKQPLMSPVFTMIEGYEAAVIQWPVAAPTGSFLGLAQILFDPSRLLADDANRALAGTAFTAWAMQPDGFLIYDRDPTQLAGHNMISDPLFAGYPDLVILAQRMAVEPEGDGSYIFPSSTGGPAIRKEAVWDTVSLHGTAWRLVVVSEGGEIRTCGEDSDCVPEQCCHPTSCINAAYKGVCTELCTLECRGPIDCGAGHCGCEDGACQVVSGPASRETFRVGIDAAYPPFSYVDEEGNLAGFDVDSVRWIAEKEGFLVDIWPIPWNDSISLLLAGNIDMIYSGMGITEDRERQVAFSIPYWEVSPSVATRTGTSWTLQDLMDGVLVVGVQRGTPSESWVEDTLIVSGKMPAEWFKRYDSLLELIAAVDDAQIDAAISDDYALAYAIRGKPLQIIGEIGAKEYLGVAVRKEDTVLLSRINEGLTRLMEDPYWKVLVQKYQME